MLTDQQIVEKVLELCGWKPAPEGSKCMAAWAPGHIYPTDAKWIRPDGQFCPDGEYLPHILTSIDACLELFEKDAPDGYWLWLETRYYCKLVGDEMHFDYIACVKADGKERCIRWLKWKGVEV